MRIIKGADSLFLYGCSDGVSLAGEEQYDRRMVDCVSGARGEPSNDPRVHTRVS